MHFRYFRKTKQSLPSESHDRSDYRPQHQQRSPYARPNDPNFSVDPTQNSRANLVHVHRSVPYAGQNDPNRVCRTAEKKEQSNPQSENRKTRLANPGPPVLAEDKQPMFFNKYKVNPRAMDPKRPTEKIDQKQPSFAQGQDPYSKSTAPGGLEDEGSTFLQPSKSFPKCSPSDQKSAYEEVHDRMLKERADDLKIIERNNATSPQELLEWLKGENRSHMDQHKFRSGFNKLKPYMSGLMNVVNFGSVFTAFESTGIAALSVGLFKSTLGVAITLCESSANMEDQIQSLISRIAVVNAYNTLAYQGGCKLLHGTLVRVYETLFEFFFKVFDLLRKGCFLTRAMAESSEIASLITKFSECCTELSLAAGFENMKAKIELMKEMFGTRSEEERKILKALGEGKEAEKNYEKAMHLGDRAQGGCKWIHNTLEFQNWFKYNKTNFLAMFGEPGSGKTTTAAYVIEILRQQQSQGDVICSFYCRDDQFRDQSKNIWSSLLAQIVDGRPDLQKWFLKQIEDPKDPNNEPIEPLGDEYIQELFVEAVNKSKARVFMVLDALDEASQEARTTMSKVLEKLSGQPSFKAFLTFRDNQEIMKDMPQGCGRLRHKNTLAENLAIAQYHVDAKFSQRRLGPEDREQIVKKIAQKADGSSVWIHMIVEYLDERTMRSLQENLRLIDKFPNKLAGVYARTFEKMAKKLGVTHLVPALQILAVACRPLTMRELSEAVSLVLGKKADSVDIYDSARTFIRFDDSDLEGGISTEKLDLAVVRLMHQSLKELVLAQEPYTWGKDTRDLKQDPESLHAARIEMMLAQACITYLQGSQFRRDLYDRSSPPPHTLKEKEKEKGLPPFFEYAASFWARHFASADSQGAISPALISASAKICQQSSRHLANWTSMFMSTSGLIFPSNPDHLLISSFFNHPSSLLSHLDSNRDGIRGFQLGQALYWSALRGNTDCVEVLLDRKNLFQPADSWVHGESPLHAAAKSGNPQCLDAVIDSQLFDIHERTRLGRTALSLAAQEDRVATINLLISEGVELNSCDNSSRTPLYWAIKTRSRAAVDALLAQPEIDLTTAGEFGNAFTIAAALDDATTMRKLKNARPQGRGGRALSPSDLTVPNEMGTTSLMFAIQHKNYTAALEHVDMATRDRLPVMEQTDRMGMTALAWAARSSDSRLLQLLTDARRKGLHCGRVLETGDTYGRTPLFYPSQAGAAAEANARILVEQWGANVNHRDIGKKTPLLFAVEFASLGVLKYLWEARGVDRLARDDEGKSALGLAKEYQQTDKKNEDGATAIVEFLSRQGCVV